MTTFYYRANTEGSQHDAFHTRYPDLPPPHIVRVSFYQGMDEPAVEIWHQPPGYCTDAYAPRYNYTSVNGPWVHQDASMSDVEWATQLGMPEIHMFSGGFTSGPLPRHEEAARWARRYGWVEP